MSKTEKAKPKRSSQGPLTIWHGMDLRTLRTFLRMKPELDWAHALKIASLGPMSLYNSVMRRAEEVLYGRRIDRASVHPQPLFIVGHWRSGTTLLHNLISRDPQFGFPNLYQVLFPNHFLLTEAVATKLTAWMLPETRPMDNVACGWDLPQEDEVALCVTSLKSPYLMMAFQTQPEKYTPYFDIETLDAEQRQEWIDAFLQMARKLSAKDPRPICFKSPSHTFRVGLFHEMFPQARFLYIYRDPYAVFNSACHLRKTMFEDNGLAGPYTDTIEQDVMKAYTLAMECYERDKVKIPEGQLHEVRFEDLEADPLGELERAYGALHLDGYDELRRRIEPDLPSIQKYKKNVFSMDPQRQRYIYENLQFAFEMYGYPSRFDETEQTDPAAASLKSSS